MTASRGEVWMADFGAVAMVKGHEQAGLRPALVLSADIFNAAGMVTVLPLTSKTRPYKTRLAIRPPEGGVTVPSWVIGEQVRTISTLRLRRRMGAVRPLTMSAVEDVVRMLLGL